MPKRNPTISPKRVEPRAPVTTTVTMPDSSSDVVLWIVAMVGITLITLIIAILTEELLMASVIAMFWFTFLVWFTWRPNVQHLLAKYERNPTVFNEAKPGPWIVLIANPYSGHQRGIIILDEVCKFYAEKGVKMKVLSKKFIIFPLTCIH